MSQQGQGPLGDSGSSAKKRGSARRTEKEGLSCLYRMHRWPLEGTGRLTEGSEPPCHAPPFLWGGCWAPG